MMNQNKEIKPRYTLEQAESINRSKGGAAFYEKYGKKGMSELAKKGWEKPSVRRQAYAIVQRAMAEIKNEYIMTHASMNCAQCGKLLQNVNRKMLLPKDLNRPTDVHPFCDTCRKRRKAAPMSEEVAQAIVQAHKENGGSCLFAVESIAKS